MINPGAMGLEIHFYLTFFGIPFWSTSSLRWRVHSGFCLSVCRHMALTSSRTGDSRTSHGMTTGPPGVSAQGSHRCGRSSAQADLLVDPSGVGRHSREHGRVLCCAAASHAEAVQPDKSPVAPVFHHQWASRYSLREAHKVGEKRNQ